MLDREMLPNMPLKAFLLGVVLLLFGGCIGSSSENTLSEQSEVKIPDFSFYDVKSQTPEFIGYFHSIKLTPEQEKIKWEVLKSIPAPCCSDYPVLTCCCECNLAKSVWGLSNYLIAEHNYNAEQLERAVREWIKFTNPSGYTGDACYSPGGCYRSFGSNGCGGMTEENLIL
jgi:hypothetical protein